MTNLALIDDGTLIVRVLDRLLAELDLACRVYKVASPWDPVEAAVGSLDPEVVLITDSHPRLTHLCEQLAQQHDVAILVLGTSPVAPPGLAAHANYLGWQPNTDELSTALTSLRDDAGPWSPQVVDSRDVADSDVADSDVADSDVADSDVADSDVASPQFSPREVEVMNAAAIGLTNSTIARKLSVSEATIKTYWRRVFTKLDVRDRTAAVAAGMAMGVVSVRCWCEDSSGADPKLGHATCVVCRSRRCTTPGEPPPGILGAVTTAVVG